MEQIATYLSIAPEIRFGKPCIKGTRITVSDILTWLASGTSHEEVQLDDPSLKEDHISACLIFE
ncbi:MAG: DUF433 domain-containing protein [Bacteroidota bacterium]